MIVGMASTTAVAQTAEPTYKGDPAVYKVIFEDANFRVIEAIRKKGVHDKAHGHLAVQTVMSSPETGASTIRTMYYLSIVCARRSIYIANPYFVPDAAAVDTLIEAKQRGVDVCIMVSGTRNDNWLARQNSIRLSGRLIAAGIDMLEYNHTMLHHKTMVVDGVWVTMGTANFDNRSFAHNEESNVCVYDRALADQLQEIFRADLKGCRRIALEEWQARGVWSRLQEFVASFLQDQV